MIDKDRNIEFMVKLNAYYFRKLFYEEIITIILLLKAELF